MAGLRLLVISPIFVGLETHRVTTGGNFGICRALFNLSGLVYTMPIESVVKACQGRVFVHSRLVSRQKLEPQTVPALGGFVQ